MYERFTDRARKVMQLANQEALRMNHEYIGTEHILLGLLKHNDGTAKIALEHFKVMRDAVATEVQRLVQCGPEMVTMGKLPQTPRAKKVIEYSMEEARNLNHNYVGTEHILLGLLREEEGVASQVLSGLGVNYGQVFRFVGEMLAESREVEQPHTWRIMVKSPKTRWPDAGKYDWDGPLDRAISAACNGRLLAKDEYEALRDLQAMLPSFRDKQ